MTGPGLFLAPLTRRFSKRTTGNGSERPIGAAALTVLCRLLSVLQKQKAGAVPAFCSSGCRCDYVVLRGFTAITVAGTGVFCCVVIVQSGSEPGAHAGRFGLICLVSVSVDTSMKCT